MSDAPLYGCIEAGGTKFVLGVAHDLSVDHAGHKIIAYSLAQLVVAQQRIVVGGGVMATSGLLYRVRAEFARLSAGYSGDLNVAQLIVSPGLGDRAGLLSTLALAQAMPR